MPQQTDRTPSLGPELDARIRQAYTTLSDGHPAAETPLGTPLRKITQVGIAPARPRRRRHTAALIASAAAAAVAVAVGGPLVISQLDAAPPAAQTNETPATDLDDLSRLYGAAIVGGLNPLDFGVTIDSSTRTVHGITTADRATTLADAIAPLADELGYTYVAQEWDAPQTIEEVPASSQLIGTVLGNIDAIYADSGDQGYLSYINHAADMATVWRGRPDTERDAAAREAAAEAGINIQLLTSTWGKDDGNALLANLQAEQSRWEALGFEVRSVSYRPVGAFVGVDGDLDAAQRALADIPGILGVEAAITSMPY